ncbi:MAG: hypothetical protein SEPTF4163_006329 [Sporothrix epigloea]
MAPGVGGKDHYAILEVPMTADDATIAASYRRLARLKHPDKNRTNPNATAEFQTLQEAYSVLKDYKARAEYDCRIHLRKKAAGAGASRARASTARTAGTSSGTSATMAATAAAVEMLRQKRKQTRQENSAASVAGIFSFHVHTGNHKATVHAKEKPKDKAKEEKRAKRSSQQQNTSQETTSQSDHTQQGSPATDYSAHEVGTMYPPPPADLPQWPDRPPGRDHALEKQIRQVRSEIRTEEKTIRRLNRGVDRKEEEIGVLWEAVRILDDELAKASAARAKIEEKMVEQEWHNALFGDQAATAADSSMPRPMSPKSAERIKQAERAYKRLQKKVVKAYEAIETSMAESRLLVDQIEKAYAEKTANEAILHELSRRWRIHEFGVDSVEGEGGDLAGSWDGWCGWGEGEGETGLGTDDKNDGTEDGSERHNHGEDGAASAAWGQWQNESANWWNSGSETVHADPSLDEWSQRSKDGVPLATHDPVDSISQGLEDVFFDTRVNESQDSCAGAEGVNLCQSLDGTYYQYQDVCDPYEHYGQYGHNSTLYEQVLGDDTTYHEPFNEEDSTRGGVALSNGSLGESGQAQRDWQRRKDAELIALESEADEQDEMGTAEANKPQATKSTAPTDEIADPLQTATTTAADTSQVDAKKDNQDAGSDESEKEGQLHGWLDASDVDMLGQASWAPVASTNVWNTATSSGAGTIAVTSDLVTPSMSLPPRASGLVSHRQGIASPISTLAGSAVATQAWWPGEEYHAAEQAGGDAREMAWRHAQWHEW